MSGVVRYVWLCTGYILAMYPRRDDHCLKPVEDGLDGDGGVHAAEVKDRVRDGGCTVVEGLNDQSESCNIRQYP